MPARLTCRFELDNRGRRLLVADDGAINTPAVAAAYAVREYARRAPDEISFKVRHCELKVGRVA